MPWISSKSSLRAAKHVTKKVNHSLEWEVAFSDRVFGKGLVCRREQTSRHEKKSNYVGKGLSRRFLKEVSRWPPGA